MTMYAALNEFKRVTKLIADVVCNFDSGIKAYTPHLSTLEPIYDNRYLLKLYTDDGDGVVEEVKQLIIPGKEVQHVFDTKSVDNFAKWFSDQTAADAHNRRCMDIARALAVVHSAGFPDEIISGLLKCKADLRHGAVHDLLKGRHKYEPQKDH